MRTLIVAGSAGALALAMLVTSSCATTEDDPGPPAEASTLPSVDAGLEAAADADAEASCDAAAAPDCVSHVVTCADAAWCPVPTNVSALYALTSVWGSGKNDVWASGSGGTVIHYDGTAWAKTATDLKNTFRTVIGTSATDIWALSASDVILHAKGFTPSGVTWTRVSAAPDPYSAAPLYAAWSSGSGELRIGGGTFGFSAPSGDFVTANGFTKTSLGDGGLGWNAAAGSGTVHGIWGAAADDVWLVVDNSAAVSWQLGLTFHGTRVGDGGGGLTWQSVDSQASVVLSAVWGSSASDVWTVGDIGTIRHLAADRSHWEPVASNTMERLNAIWGSAKDDVWAVGDAGTILHFDGTRWAPSIAAFPVGKTKPNLYGVWGSSATDVWIVGDGIALRATTAGGSK